MSLLDRPGLFWQVHSAGWLAFSTIYIVATVQVLPVWHAAADKAAFGGSGFLVSLGLWRVCRRVRRWSWPAMIVAVCSACYVGGLVWSALYSWILIVTGWSASPMSFPRLLGGSLAMSATLLAWCGLYFVGVSARALEHQQEELARERERALAARAEVRDAQLRALRYQLDPHFLFNTLNAVSTLVAERQTDAAQATIARLADFLRATLDDRDAPEITLARELELVDRYLAIERARLQERLQVHIEASEEALDACVPALLLQPLVENAVRHGIAKRPGIGRLEIVARCANGRVRIVVRDAAAAGSADCTHESTAPLGLGLANTRARLTVLFASDFDLSIHSIGGVTEVRIDLPFVGQPVTTAKLA